MKKKILFGIGLIFVGILAGLYIRDHLPGSRAAAKVVTITSRNLDLQTLTTGRTVGEVLAQEHFSDSAAAVDPEQTVPVHAGMTIAVRLPLRITLVDGGREQGVTTTAATVGDFIAEQKIALSATDQVTPDFSVFLSSGLRLVIDRIVDLPVTETHGIPYQIQRQNDSTQFYGLDVLVSPGQLGQKQQDFLITYKNGVEIKRKLLAEKILRQPTAEVRIFGTKIVAEETREGQASWYVYKNCMCAAHPFYAKGRYVRVTNLASGKSIIVQVNDQGPDLSVFPNRIIDLDAVAFRQLASLAEGTISVRVDLLQAE